MAPSASTAAPPLISTPPFEAAPIAASPAILMVDLSESGDPLNDINALAEVCEPGTVVIAIGQVNDVRLYRDLVASGIHDYLLKPLSAGQLRDALNQAQAVFASPRQLAKNLEPTYLQKNEFNADVFVMPPEKGRMLMWPSHVPHAVEEGNADESQDRIVVAFNVMIRGKSEMSTAAINFV